MKLDSGNLHLLRLAMREADADGWAKVSRILWPVVAKLPDDLVEKRPEGDAGFIRLTSGGNAVANYS